MALVCWRRGQLDALAAAFDAGLQPWRSGWGLEDGPGATCRAAVPADLAVARWMPLLRDGVAQAWLHLPPGLEARIAHALFGCDAATGTLVLAVAAACRDAAVARLAAVIGMKPQQSADGAPAPEEGRPWSGAVLVTLPPLGGFLLLAARAMRSWAAGSGSSPAQPAAIKPAQPVVSVDRALARHPVPLDIRLQGCELDLGALLQMRAGDVVRTPHALQAPGAVMDDTGAVLFHAFLGRHQGRKAVELAAPPAPADPAFANHPEVRP